MFPGMFGAKPDKATALKQLRFHVTGFALFVAIVRATPYVLQALQKDDELTLDF